MQTRSRKNAPKQELPPVTKAISKKAAPVSKKAPEKKPTIKVTEPKQRAARMELEEGVAAREAAPQKTPQKAVESIPE